MRGKKVLAIALATSILSFNSLVYAKDKGKIGWNVRGKERQCLLRQISGSIVNVNFSDKGKYILVGEKYPTSVFVVTKNTKIINSKGEELSFYDLKDGMKITGYHNGISTKSLPPQYVVNSVIVHSQESGSLVTEGVVTKIHSSENEESKMLLINGRKGIKDALTEINLLVDKNTEILDQLGQKLTMEDLKEGIIVEGVYGRAVTKSYPAKGVAKKVIIRKDRAVSKGTISSISIGEKWSKVLIGDEYLIVSSDTTIEDSKGNKLEFKDLKEGMNIVSFGSVVVALSYPSQRSVYNIIVMD